MFNAHGNLDFFCFVQFCFFSSPFWSPDESWLATSGVLAPLLALTFAVKGISLRASPKKTFSWGFFYKKVLSEGPKRSEPVFNMSTKANRWWSLCMPCWLGWQWLWALWWRWPRKQRCSKGVASVILTTRGYFPAPETASPSCTTFCTKLRQKAMPSLLPRQVELHVFSSWISRRHLSLSKISQGTWYR